MADASFEAYDRWNAAVEKFFFSGDLSGRPAYLDIEDDVLEALAAGARVDGADAAEAFRDAVRPTLYLPPETDGSLLDLHVRRVRRWRQSSSPEAPPVLAVLAFFARAAETMRSDEQFRANNYYARLCEALGVDPTNRRAVERVGQGYRRGSRELWDALAAWLLDYEGILGMPTAEAFDWRSYVGLPLSQALLKEHERLALREAFVDFRLSAGSRLSPSDMERLLGDWVKTGPWPGGLKTLFRRSKDARAQIAEIASLELESWDGALPEEGERCPSRPGHLLLQAQLRRRPRPRLILRLAAAGVPHLSRVTLKTRDDSAPAEFEALRESNGRIELGESLGGSWRDVEVRGPVSYADLLIAKLHLAAESGDGVLTRDPHRLVALVRDPELPIFVESQRARLGVKTVILAHESIAAKVRKVLESDAREGCIEWRSDNLAGLPESWLAFSDVELVDIPDISDGDVDLQPLVPLEWTSITLGEGMALPGRSTWLRQGAPEVVLSSFVDRAVAASLQGLTLTGDRVEHDLGLVEATSAVSLREIDLADGDYRILLQEGKRPLESVGLRLRSANAPRLRRGLPAGLGHDLSEPIGALSASPLEDHDHGHACAVVGGWIDGEIGNAVKRPMPMLGPLGARPIFDLADESDEPLQGPVEARSSVGSLCAVGVTGHHFALESRAVGTGRGKKTRGECKNCGLERWIGPGARRKTLLIGKVSKRIKPAASRHSSDPTTPDFEACFSLDVLLEALCFTRAGSWAQFDRLAAQCSDESWFVAETARLLSSLGHIDFQLDLRTHRPQTWHVAPTALVNVDNKTAIIVGHRSDDILERVADDAEALGGRLTKESRDGAPAKLIVRGLDLSALFQLAESVAEATSNPTRVCAAGARGIAEVLPAWTDLLGALKMAPWPAEPMERFDVGQNRWVPVPMLSAAGAYKTVSRPSLFSFYPGMGSELWVADSRTIKWLAAACEGQSILGYDRDTQVLRCLLGAQLPGLYERAAVLCSGDAPVVETSGTVAYATVTADVAAAISGRLGS